MNIFRKVNLPIAYSWSNDPKQRSLWVQLIILHAGLSRINFRKLLSPLQIFGIVLMYIQEWFNGPVAAVTLYQMLSIKPVWCWILFNVYFDNQFVLDIYDVSHLLFFFLSFSWYKSFCTISFIERYVFYDCICYRRRSSCK